jgi:hypothetical protein
MPENKMDKIDHLMAEKNGNNKDSLLGQVTPKKYLKKTTAMSELNGMSAK